MATRLIPKFVPFPAGFRARGPNAFAQEFINRLVIELPDGGLQWQIGGIKPTSNVGPWLKDGTKPYVWSEDLKDYVPMDLSDSVSDTFWFGDTTPTETTPAIWFKVTSVGGHWMVYSGTAWVVARSPISSGTTAQRPASPADLERFWDTTINTEIHFERGQWRTVGGTPGDVKMVDVPGADYATVVTEALARNPGWDVVSVQFQGRAPIFAGSGVGLTARAPLASVGDETVTLTEDQLPAHRHNLTTAGSLPGQLERLSVNTSGSARPLGKAGDSPDTAPPTVATYTGYNRDSAAATAPHSNMQPSIALVGLKKG